MSKLTKRQEKIIAKFAEDNKHWDKKQLDAALWRIKWQLTALPHQKEPDDNEYDTFLMLAGRGSGKTHTASHWIGIRAWMYPNTRWLVSAPTSNDIRVTCYEGDSGLINIIPDSIIENYNRSLAEITLVNKSIIQGIPGSEPERYRGKQFHGAWWDELAAFDYLDEAWDQGQFTLRLRDPNIKRVQQIVTTTPKPRDLIVDLNEAKVGGDVFIATASSYDNKANLSQSFFNQLKVYEGTKLGDQEIHGAILDPEDSGIVKRNMFKMWDAKTRGMPQLEYVIVSVDPATSEKTVNDPTACVVFGVFESTDGMGIIILDAWSDHLSYPELRRKVIDDYREVVYGADDDTFASGRKADLILMEDKSAGISLIQELQQAGLPVRGYNPGRADKVQRLNIVAPIVSKGFVYIFQKDDEPGEIEDWMKPFMRQVCSFPEATHDDYVDCLSQALRVLRDAGWVQLDAPIGRLYDYAEDRPRKQRYNPYSA